MSRIIFYFKKKGEKLRKKQLNHYSYNKEQI
jgi:hypothetical protein